ncbi:MAG: hypothetical protein ABIM89_13110 [Mycobacteriales bacterium]
MQRQEIAAAIAAAHSVACVVVGSAALRMQGVDITARDLDLVVAPAQQNLDRLTGMLANWGVLRRPSDRALRELDIITLESSFGPIDLLLRTGRERYAALRSSAVTKTVADVRITLASVADCWSLRQEFGKGSA